MSNSRIFQIERNLDADRALIGGKATSLVKLLEIGAPVPSAFVLTTNTFRDWARGDDESLIKNLIVKGIKDLEKRTSQNFGSNNEDALVVSVRSGAPISMPGMMDTVLNVGLSPINEKSDLFACDARKRFLMQFSEIVVGIPSPNIEELEAIYDQVNPSQIYALENELRRKAAEKGFRWPETPMEELVAAAEAVFASWQSSRAKLYRRMNKIDDQIGTSVTVQQMVFGNKDGDSGSGIAFTRNPTNGDSATVGEFMFWGQGEEIVSGRKTAQGLHIWEERQPENYNQLCAIGKKLEDESGKVFEIEFTVEQGRLYILQCRPALLTARGAAKVAVEMYREGLLSQEKAVEYARTHGFDPKADKVGLIVSPEAQRLAQGLPVGGAVVTGRIAFSASRMNDIEKEGDPAILLSVETSPNSLPLMQRAVALITIRGGATSHAAVVAREMGITCVVGVGGELLKETARLDETISEGSWVTVDGIRGEVYSGAQTVRSNILSEEEKELRSWAGLEHIS